MAHEMLVGLQLRDPAGYQRYRDAMAPLLREFGGGFRYDFTIAEVLRSAAPHPIDRLFTIHFPDRARAEAFFADARYRAIRARWFEPAVQATTILAQYEHHP
jgi:uncharacterized protein (DUF1330 family)